MSEATTDTEATEPTGRRIRSDGARSRDAILRKAAALATVEGIEGLSLSRLAEAVGMSKSGVYAHFGSKEELQLATVEFASDVLDDEVINPAASAEPGVPRLVALAENYVGHVRESVYPGGCFLAAAMTEMNTHPGPVKERTFEFTDSWRGLWRAEVEAAQEAGALRADIDAGQLAFELNAPLFLANVLFVAQRDDAILEGALTAVRERLQAAAA